MHERGFSLMSRLPKTLTARLRKRFGISRRTFERWCARGDVPGAYRTRGGHWRVRKPTDAVVASLPWRRLRNGYTKTRREKVRDAIISFYPEYRVRIKKFEETVFDLQLIAADTYIGLGITDTDFYVAQLKRAALEKKEPLSAADWLRHNGKEVTPRTLARVLGMSVSTLYRKYGAPVVRKAWHGPISMPSPIPISLWSPSRPRS
jgi:predicted DNA-binding transcriptional regulator AlpA